jgi:Zn-dependent metalloprotease
MTRFGRSLRPVAAQLLLVVGTCLLLGELAREVVPASLDAQLGLGSAPDAAAAIFYLSQGVALTPTHAPGAHMSIVPLGALLVLLAALAVPAFRARRRGGRAVAMVAGHVLPYSVLAWIGSFVDDRVATGVPAHWTAFLLPMLVAAAGTTIGFRLADAENIRHRLLRTGLVVGALATLEGLALAALAPHAAWDLLGRPQDTGSLAVEALLVGPNLLLTGLVAALGVPVEWSATFVATSGGTLQVGPYLPIAVAAVVAAVAARSGRSAPRVALATAAGLWLSIALTAGQLKPDFYLGASVHYTPLFALALPAAFGLIAALGAAAGRRGATARGRTQLAHAVAIASLAALLAAAVLGSTAEPGAAPSGARITSLLSGAQGIRGTPAMRAGTLVRIHVPAARRQRARRGSRRLRSDSATPAVLTRDPRVGTVGFAQVELPVPNDSVRSARDVAEDYAPALGFDSLSGALRLQSRDVDHLGMAHVRFTQAYRGYPVFGGSLSIHFSDDGTHVAAVSNGLVPGVTLPDDAAVTVTSEQTVATAKRALPDGRLTGRPHVEVFAGQNRQQAAHAKLVWLVELADPATGVSNTYAIDAESGDLIAVIEHQQDARNRQIYTADHASVAVRLARAEGQGPTGDADVDGAYDGTGATYDYYNVKFGRDSYDGNGATLFSTVHVGTNWPNASWSSSAGMYYGDGYAAARDVTGHELTHAVTEHSAALVYQDEPGAINEAFSDIFGEMVERYSTGHQDWLIGEQIPGGAIRSMANPTLYSQPDTLSGYVETCYDSGGVHTNSGIINRAFYLTVQNIGADKAERIFYRTLTHYLNTYSNMEAVRGGAKQSATDLYGPTETVGVTNAFDAVGLNGVLNPPPASCGGGGCGALTALSGAGLDGLSPTGADRNTVLTTMYRVRDSLMHDSSAGQHFSAEFDTTTGRLSELLVSDPALREDAAHLLQGLTPPLDALMDGNGDEATMTPGLVDEMRGFLDSVAQADEASGGGRLARVIREEEGIVNLDSLEGKTFDQALAELDARVSQASPSGGP